MDYAPPRKFTLYGDTLSGNCLKTRWIADSLGLDYDWVQVDVVRGEARAAAFLAVNPVGKVPLARWPDGRTLPESNAIMLYLAETNVGGERFLPDDPFQRAQMMSWLFWEQYAHEPAIAVRRYQRHLLGRREEDIDPALMEKGSAALALMQRQLSFTPWLVGDGLTLADVALVAYTRWSHEAGFDLGEFPAVAAWVPRVEQALGIAHAGPAPG
jgi:glutathione S-transferase